MRSSFFLLVSDILGLRFVEYFCGAGPPFRFEIRLWNAHTCIYLASMRGRTATVLRHCVVRRCRGGLSRCPTSLIIPGAWIRSVRGAFTLFSMSLLSLLHHRD
jgi:hypothetical protein